MPSRNPLLLVFALLVALLAAASGADATTHVPACEDVTEQENDERYVVVEMDARTVSVHDESNGVEGLQRVRCMEAGVRMEPDERTHHLVAPDPATYWPPPQICIPVGSMTLCTF